IAGTVAAGQRPPGGNPNLWHPSVGLLGWIKVRDELKLTPAQVEKIRDFGDERIEKHERPLEESLGKLTEEERRQKFAAVEKRQKEATEKATEALTAEQARRYRQMEIWTMGPLAFSYLDLTRDLDLTEAQRGALKTIGDELENERNARAKRLQRDFRVRLTKEEQAKRREELAENTKKDEELRAAKLAECLSVLTDDQKARFEILRGPQFELLPERPRAQRDRPADH